MHKLQLDGNYCNLVAKYQSKVRYARKRGQTLHVTCDSHGPAPGDVIGGMSPFAVFDCRSNTFVLTLNWEHTAFFCKSDVDPAD